jgi:predicted GTPase
VRDLEATIERVPCEVVVIATPIDLSRVVKINQPFVRVRYELQEIARPDLADALHGLMEQLERRPVQSAS